MGESLRTRILDDPPHDGTACIDQSGIVEPKRPDVHERQPPEFPKADARPSRVVVGPPAYPNPRALLIDAARPRAGSVVIAADYIGWAEAQRPQLLGIVEIAEWPVVRQVVTRYGTRAAR